MTCGRFLGDSLRVFKFATFSVTFYRAVLGVVADFEEVGVEGEEFVAVVPSGGFDVQVGLQPGGGVEEGLLCAVGADSTLAAVAVGAEPLLEDLD